MMKLLPYYLLMILCCAGLISCEHRVLVDLNDKHYVRVYLDEQIRNVTFGFYNPQYSHPEYRRPQALRVSLASQNTGKVQFETVLRNYGSDERGTYMDGYIAALAGDYHMIINELGSSVTQIDNTSDYYGITAYTDPISERMLAYLPVISDDIDLERTVVEPEHLMAAKCDNVSIPRSIAVDTLRNENGNYFTAQTIAKSYYLQLRIKGVEWVHAAAAVLSGMSGSFKMGLQEGIVTTDPVNLFFIMNYAEKKRNSSDEVYTAILNTTFTTFGKIEDLASVLYLNFEFTKNDGTTQVESIDITDVFKTPMAIENQWLLLDKEIVITEPTGTGGVVPGVEGWKDIEADIIM